jgi:hypothetical protein
MYNLLLAVQESEWCNCFRHAVRSVAVCRYGAAKHAVKELSKFKKKAVRGQSLKKLNLDGNLESYQLYSEFYRTCGGGHPDPSETNKVFQNEWTWVQINATNWM